MRLLFVADPLHTFKIHKDSSFAMMREAQRRGHTLASCEPQDLVWTSGDVVRARVTSLRISHGGEPDRVADAHDWFELAPQSGDESAKLCEFDAIVMRKDPPFDSEYFYATHLLQQAEREGARVFNSPRALRDHPEKLALMEFAQFAAPTVVTRQDAVIRAFHAQHRDIILKPLDGMGGAGIFRVADNGLNLGAIIETLTRDGAETIMVQRYLPEIALGDKRILVIDGQAVPFSLARIPQGGEVRGNLAAGGKGVAQPLTERDQAIAKAIGPVLAERGLLLVGLDVIGDKLTEINVTSPTCFQEITDQADFDVAAMFVDALERRSKKQ